jgi:hypothetical protein
VICGKEKNKPGTQFGPTPTPSVSGATPVPSKSPSQGSTKAPAVTPGAGDAAPARS